MGDLRRGVPKSMMHGLTSLPTPSVLFRDMSLMTEHPREQRSSHV